MEGAMTVGPLRLPGTQAPVGQHNRGWEAVQHGSTNLSLSCPAEWDTLVSVV